MWREILSSNAEMGRNLRLHLVTLKIDCAFLFCLISSSSCRNWLCINLELFNNTLFFVFPPTLFPFLSFSFILSFSLPLFLPTSCKRLYRLHFFSCYGYVQKDSTDPVMKILCFIKGGMLQLSPQTLERELARKY